MYTGTYSELMAQYNQWMNQKLYAICAGLTDAERRADRGAFFKSIHGTLNHILYGDKMWIGRFDGNPFTGAKIGQDLHATFEEMHADRVRTDQRILTWAANVDPEWLKKSYTWISGIDGKSRTSPTHVLVTQMFNHQTHHRGQITTLLMQMGINPGPTDIPLLPQLGGDTL
ncbi:MAG: DinB family protein [Gammaproteobacteria bacterium]|nr:DinB family protein [Gammaproteobacteria bacterium]